MYVSICEELSRLHKRIMSVTTETGETSLYIYTYMHIHIYKV